MNFVALDVETANCDCSSICQVGLVVYKNNQLTESLDLLVDPQDYFDELNVSIHGITKKMVKGQPSFPDVYARIFPYLEAHVVVTHTAFDRAAINQAMHKYHLQDASFQWLDTARVVRRAWPEFQKRGYGLANVAKSLGIEFQHHNAKEDARAAAEILIQAMEHTHLTIEEWAEKCKKPITPRKKRVRVSEKREANPDGVLFGEVAVFTGALTMPRKDAVDLAAEAGCAVASSVNKHTTLLIAGDQDVRKLHGKDKSTKHQKAEELIRKGQSIRVLSETDFLQLVDLYHYKNGEVVQ